MGGQSAPTLSGFRLADGKWDSIERSVAFPSIRFADFAPFLARLGIDDDTSVLADLNSWLLQLKASLAARND